jgi:integrase
LEDEAMALTLKLVERLRQKPGRYSDGGNLFLQVKSPTNCSWLFRWERDGRQMSMGLGALKTFNLHEARERARKARQLLADGINPLEARRVEEAERALAAATSKTFQECAEACFDAVSKSWKNKKHIAQFSSSMRMYVYPIIGQLPVATIDVALVLKILEQKVDNTKFWEARPETAARVRARIETVLSWATVRGYRSGDNPARWDGFLATQLPSRGKKFAPVKHHPALPFDEIPRFMCELRTRNGIAPKALEFTILTAARTGAVIGAAWDEIDLNEKVWTVPPNRAGTKIDGDKPRRVPLSPRAIELLKALPRERNNPHVFLGPREGAGLSNAAMSKVLELIGRDDVTVHGFRSTFKDWVSERTSYANHVSEAALWHAVADQVEAAYRRGDLFEKRRRLMNEWARYCVTTPVEGAVLSFRM